MIILLLPARKFSNASQLITHPWFIDPSFFFDDQKCVYMSLLHISFHTTGNSKVVACGVIFITENFTKSHFGDYKVHLTSSAVHCKERQLYYPSSTKTRRFVPRYAELLPSLWSPGLGWKPLLLLWQILLIAMGFCTYGLKWRQKGLNRSCCRDEMEWMIV